MTGVDADWRLRESQHTPSMQAGNDDEKWEPLID